MLKYILILLGFLPLSDAFSQSNPKQSNPKNKADYPQSHNSEYWKKKLSENSYEIMVNKGTEPPFRNAYFNNHEKGVYVSMATGDTLFTSETKFESGTGWPSFFEAKDPKKILIVKDNSYGMERDEVVEAKTGLHLGHLFMDGPNPTGKRYCMNSAAFKFVPYQKKGK